MSGTQSTLTDRTPNFLNKEPTDKKPKNEKASVSLKNEFDPTGLVQRCVIIQRDENGFGLTVSGDNPVFVQLVKEDGAAMRAGVQTGDRIIKVNGTLVTHSNHIEVVKLIKSGSYVALTVLGRPPGLPQITLDEEEPEEVREGKDDGEVSATSSPSVPRSPTPSGGERSSGAACGPDRPTSSPSEGDCRSSDADERDGALPELRGEPSPQRCENGNVINNNSVHGGPPPESPGARETPCQSPDVGRRDGHADGEDAHDNAFIPQGIVGSPPYVLNLQIIGAEDDYFDSQQEQINGRCSCFESIDLLKCRPAHLAVFLHHVVSQFDPAPLLCYLYADMHKQTTSKESRRFFMEFHSLFMDRTANLKVPIPEAVSAELEKRRLELIPEELCKQYTQTLQETLLADLHKNLEDFRQKRSMGLTLAEDELSKLDWEGGKEPQALEKECCCAEHILSKIEDILMTSQPSEEEKCQTMQYVILTYMKHLGVKVKEPRGLEHKRARINFLPKIKKSIKPEKEGEEKVKKPRFPNILGPPRRLSRVDSTSVGKAVELNKQRSPKLSQPAFGIPELGDSPASTPGRVRANQPSEGSDSSVQTSATSPTLSTPTGPISDNSGQESDTNLSPLCVQPRPGEALQPSDQQDVSGPAANHFDFSPSNLEQRDDDQDAFRMDLQCTSPADVQSEDDQAGEAEGEEDPLNWQRLVGRDVLASLKPQEIKRQEVINELFYTERAHLRMLKVLDCVFHQRLSRDGVLPPDDIRHIFSNLEDIVQLHVSIIEQMTAIRKRSETSVIGQIGDDLLSWFGEEEEEKIRRALGTFCSNQPSALELIKTRQKKDQRFNVFMQEAESNRLCRRLQLKDIIPVEMQRVTKYPLLLDNIAKYTEDGEEREKVKKAAECCKKVLNHVNEAVKEAENKQRLEEYQRRLDFSSLKQSENPVILEVKSLDLTKRTMVHEGPLSWKVNKDKTIELYTILLEDIMVLLQKQDERLVLKFHGKNVASVADTKHIFSPIIKLNTVIVRPVATDNKSFFVLSMSENGAQIYELTAQTVSDQRTWQCLITQCADAMKAKPHCAASDAERDAIEIIDGGIPKPGKESNEAPAGDVNAPDIPAPAGINPFDGLKSEDEEEELAEGSRQEEEEDEEEVDEAELEAFLDGQLVEMENEEHDSFTAPSSKAEEALKTLATLKQALFTHLMSRDADEKDEAEEERRRSQPSSPDGASAPCGASGGAEGSHQDEPTPGLAPEAPQRNGGFVVLDVGGASEESSTDDDAGVGCDAGIDMRKLLSSSQTGSGGPNLSRQLMTHLRLLQADLQYLKDVEARYNELRHTHSDATTESDDNHDGIP